MLLGGCSISGFPLGSVEPQAKILHALTRLKEWNNMMCCTWFGRAHILPWAVCQWAVGLPAPPSSPSCLQDSAFHHRHCIKSHGMHKCHGGHQVQQKPHHCPPSRKVLPLAALEVPACPACSAAMLTTWECPLHYLQRRCPIPLWHLPSCIYPWLSLMRWPWLLLPISISNMPS